MTLAGEAKSLLSAALALGLTTVLVAATPSPGPPSAEMRSTGVSLDATVLTLEGGLVGLQHIFHATPRQLGGALCDVPDRCEPVDYFAMPLGQKFNDQGAVLLNAAIDALPDDDTPITLFGHSQGGQVIYSALRGWAENPATAPDPARVSWVSIGNPENAFGGRAANPTPADSPYQGVEVIRQYDGWADWPTDERNVLAVLNATVGMSSTHMFGYADVNLDDPNNIRYQPTGAGGNVTYVFVPTPVLPLVAMTGVLAPLLNPILDPILRPIVEAGYQRPIGTVTGSTPAARPSASLSSTSLTAAAVDQERSESVAEPHRRAVTAGAPNSQSDRVTAQPRRAGRGQHSR